MHTHGVLIFTAVLLTAVSVETTQNSRRWGVKQTAVCPHCYNMVLNCKTQFQKMSSCVNLIDITVLKWWKYRCGKWFVICDNISRLIILQSLSVKVLCQEGRCSSYVRWSGILIMMGLFCILSLLMDTWIETCNKNAKTISKHTVNCKNKTKESWKRSVNLIMPLL